MAFQHDLELQKVQKNMAKSGVGWFKFDEASGNVVDSKGTAISTITGVSRITGWDGKGFALNFTGSSYVAFNQKVIPVGTKVIRFKFKRNGNPSAWGALFTTTSFEVNSSGFICGLNSAGKIGFTVRNNGVSTDIFSAISVCDNAWHDIEFVLDRNSNKWSVIVDKTHITNGTPPATENVHWYNLKLGASALNGDFQSFQMDELQIYNNLLDWTINKTLIKNNDGVYVYLGQSGTWETLPNEPTVQDFLDYGMDALTDAQIQDFKSKYGKQYRILRWTDGDAATSAKLKAVPQSQLILPKSDISIVGVDTIDQLTLTANGNVKCAISFDSGITWKSFDGTNWESVVDASNGMDDSIFNSLTPIQLNEARNDSNFIRFSYYLEDGNAEVDNVLMKVSMLGYEKPANTSDYTWDYDEVNHIITYNITKSGTYTVTYVEATESSPIELVVSEF